MSIYCDKCGARHDSSVCPSCSGFGKNPPMTADDVRARFEAWLLRLGYTSRPERRPSGKYVNGQIQGNWLAWQAAHADLSGDVRELAEDARWLLSQMPHNEFSHDYIKDEKRCDTCKRIKRISAALAKFHPTQQETK